MTDYRVSIHPHSDPTRTIFQTDDILSLDYTLNANDTTELSVTFQDDFGIIDLPIDSSCILRLYRRPKGALTYYLEGETEWIVATRETNRITAYHPNVILDWRIVAYPPDSEYADKTEDLGTNLPADLMIIEYINQNLGPDTIDTTRIIPDLEIDAATGDYSTATEMTAGWRNLLGVIQELIQELDDNGERRHFVMLMRNGKLTFRLRPRCLNDQLESKVFFGEEYGNVAEINLIDDYRHINVCYAGGEGQGEDQLISERKNMATLTSPIWRREGFQAFGDIFEDSVLEAHGDRFLRENRPRRLAKAKVQDTELYRYGVDYHHGDMVSLLVNGTKYTCHVFAVSVSVSEDGEQVDIYLEGESEL